MFGHGYICMSNGPRFDLHMPSGRHSPFPPSCMNPCDMSHFARSQQARERASINPTRESLHKYTDAHMGIGLVCHMEIAFAASKW